MNLKKRKFNLSVGYVLFMVSITLLLNFCTNHTEKNVENVNKQHELSNLVDSANQLNVKQSPKETLSLLPNAFVLAKELNDSTASCRLMIIKAGAFYLIGSYDSSFVFSWQAAKTAKSMADDTLLAKANILLGHYYLHLNNNIKAAEYYTQAMRQVVNTDDPAKALILNSLGNIYKRLGELNTSIKCYSDALSLLDTINEEFESANVYFNLAMAYKELNDSINAWKYYQKSYSILEKKQDTSLLINLLISRALIYLNASETDSALISLNKALDYACEVNDKWLYNVVLYNIGNFYFTVYKDMDKAKYYIGKCIAENRETSNIEIKTGSLLILSEIEEHKGNYKKSNKYFKEYISLRDSVEGGDAKKEIKAIKLLSELQRQEYEASLIKQKLVLRVKQNTIVVVSLVAFLLFLSMIILVIHTSNNNLKKANALKSLEQQRTEEKMEKDTKIREIEKLKMDAELALRKKELVGFSIRLVTKNDLLNKISTLAKKYNSEKTLNTSFYNSLSEIIEENTNIEREWDQFKEQFEQVHHGFFNHLKEKLPSLTEHELRFCAYLKIGLGTKEIARLLNITPETVRKFKSRLKKKFLLDKDSFMEDFLRQN